MYDTNDGVAVSLPRCTHGGANLCDSYFNGKYTEYPLYQGLFDVRSGEAVAAPARVKLRMLNSRVQNGMVQMLL